MTGAVHTKVTGYTYDADSNVLTTTISDATGGDPSRTTTSTYNTHGQLASTATTRWGTPPPTPTTRSATGSARPTPPG